MVERFQYDAYGKRTVLSPTLVAASDTFVFNHGFAGGKADTVTGRVNFRNREYDVDLIRWTTMDPIGFDVLVEQMADGGMGSLRFLIPSIENSMRRLGEVFAQGEFNDEDGVPVSFTVNLDKDGKLFELDLWRVDFEPLKRLPRKNEVVIMLADSA